MKNIIIAILLLLAFNAEAQFYGGTEYTINSSYKVVVMAPHFSVTGKRIPVFFIFQGNGEYGTSSATYFAQGFGKRYRTDSAYMRNNFDSMYSVLILPTTFGDIGGLEQPNRQITIFNWFQTNFPQGDTLNYNLGGFSQGAINVAGALIWPSPEDGGSLSSFGLNTAYQLKRVKRIFMGSPCSPRSGSVYSKMANRVVYLMHGDADGTCGVANTNNYYTDFAAGGANVTKVILPGQGHSAYVWDSLASIRSTDSTKNMWLRIEGKTAGGSSNIPPVANAGADQTITLPTNSVSITGTASTDADGTISSYAWTKISGPGTYTINFPSSASTTITGMGAGVYVFTLTVTDNLGATNSDNITITVNSAPATHILAGYINTTNSSDYTNACALGSGGITTGAYTDDGTMAPGKVLTNVAGTLLGLSPYQYYPFAPTLAGTPTLGLQVYATDYVNGTSACGGGGGGGGGITQFAYNDSTGVLRPVFTFAMNNGVFPGGYSESHDKLFRTPANDNGLFINGAVPRIKMEDWTGNDSTFYPGRGGLQFLVDLVGDTNMTKFTTRDTLTDLVVLENVNYNPKDTLFVFVVDTVIQNANKDQGLQEFVRPDSLLTAIGYIAFANRSNTWDSLHFATPIPARYLLFWMPVHDSTASLGAWTYAQPGAIRLKGKETSLTVNPFVFPTTPIPTTTFDSLIGQNGAVQVDDTLVDASHQYRQYEFRGDFDKTLVALASKPLINMDGRADGQNVLNQMDRFAATGKEIIYSLRGTSAYLRSRMPGYKKDNGIPISDAYMDPRLFKSFYRAGYSDSKIAAKMGSGNTTDESYYTNSGSYIGMNHGSVHKFEAHNETHSDFNANQTAVSQFAQLKVLRDSLDVYDPSMQLVGGSTTSQDLEYFKTFWVMTQLFDAAKRPIVSQWDYHWYKSRLDSLYYNSGGQYGFHQGATENWDSGYAKNIKYLNVINTLSKGRIKAIHGELGYEEHDSAKYINSSFYTFYPTPKLSNKTIGESRFIAIYQTYINDLFAGVNASVFYETVNVSYIAMGLYTTGIPNLAMFAQMGMGWGDTSCCSGPHMPNKTESYYLHPFIKKHASKYKPSTALTWARDSVYYGFLRNTVHTDSLMFIGYWANDSINTTHSVDVVVPGGFSGTPKIIKPHFAKTSIGDTTTASFTGSTLHLTLDATPQIILMSQVAAAPPSCTTNSSPSNGSTIGTQTTATVVWNSAATATSYDVYRDGVFIANTASTSYGFTGLTASITYSWYVTPKNADGSATGCSSSATNFTTAAVAIPSCTTNISANVSNTSVTLSWNAASGATSYDLYYRLNGGSYGSPVNVGATSTTLNGLLSGSVYNWYVSPRNSSGVASGCSTSATSFTAGSNKYLWIIGRAP